MTPTIRWQLRFGDRIIANIMDAHATDWPWTYGTLVESPQFEAFRKYFSDWDLDDDSEIEELITTVESMGAITLHDNKTGRTYITPVFNHNGETVWFRLHEHEASARPGIETRTKDTDNNKMRSSREVGRYYNGVSFVPNA